jgi:glycerol transport system ATP-binding protein
VAAVLLDEPLTVVDPALRWTLRSKLKEIHRDTGHTLVYVTHDQTEALTFADEVVVMQDGGVVQSGEPTELFLSPAHEFVGHFIGSPGMNMIPAELTDGVVRVGDTCVGRAVGTDGELSAGAVRIGVRPEFVRVCAVPTAPGLPARVTAIDRMGAYHLVHAEIDGRRLSAKADTGSRHAPGALAYFHFVPDRAFLFRDAVRCGSIAAHDATELR